MSVPERLEKVFEMLTEENKDTLTLVAKGMQVAQENAMKENIKKEGE